MPPKVWHWPRIHRAFSRRTWLIGAGLATIGVIAVMGMLLVQERLGRTAEVVSEIDRLSTARTAELKAFADEVRAGTKTHPQLREKIQDSGNDYGAQLKGLEGNQRYRDAFKKLRDTKLDDRPATDALRLYNMIIHDPKWDKPEDFDKRAEEVEKFRQRIGELLWADMQDVIKAKRADDDPLVQQYYKDQATLKPYWEMGKTLNPYLTPKEQAIWRAYLKEPDHAKRREMELDNPGLEELPREVRSRRLELRGQNREIEKALLRWGYVTERIEQKATPVQPSELPNLPTVPRAPRVPIGEGR